MESQDPSLQWWLDKRHTYGNVRYTARRIFLPLFLVSFCTFGSFFAFRHSTFVWIATLILFGSIVCTVMVVYVYLWRCILKADTFEDKLHIKTENARFAFIIVLWSILNVVSLLWGAAAKVNTRTQSELRNTRTLIYPLLCIQFMAANIYALGVYFATYWVVCDAELNIAQLQCHTMAFVSCQSSLCLCLCGHVNSTKCIAHNNPLNNNNDMKKSSSIKCSKQQSVVVTMEQSKVEEMELLDALKYRNDDLAAEAIG